MDDELVEQLINYAKEVPCASKNYDTFCCNGGCLLKEIPYEFSCNENKYKRNLCFLITHVQDINKFKRRLENARIKISIKGEL